MFVRSFRGRLVSFEAVRARRKPLLTGLAVVVAVSVPSGVVWTQYASAARMGSLTPAPGAATKEGRPDIHLRVDHAQRLADLRVTVDGVDLSRHVRRVDDGFRLVDVPMADGRHRVRLRARSTGLFGGEVRRDWSFEVDTSVPTLRVAAPRGTWASDATVAGRTEPGAAVTVTWTGGRAATTPDADGRFRVPLDLPEGLTRVRIESRDRAGNRRATFRVVRLDSVPPKIEASAGWIRWQRKTTSPTFGATVSDATKLRYEATLDGEAAKAEPRPGGGFDLAMQQLGQGEHTLVVTAIDQAGNRTSIRRRFGVDTTDTLSNDLTLGPGARGGDVRAFAERLQRDGWLKGPLPDVYGPRLTSAVQRYQRRNGFEVDGIARPAILAATAGKVVVIKHQFRAYVHKDGRIVASFPVAIGAPKFPTPTGSFTIVSKIKDPTWIPPNSPWAEGLEPVPPGKDNPLGPRWIGTSAPAIGFHGTPADASVGTAASHGCLRMHFADVKRLYDLVEVGMPVQFTA
jgi:hypothetical protein